LRKHADTFTPLGFAPAVFVLGLLLGPLLACLAWWLALAYAGGVGLYLLAVMAGSVGIASQARDWRMLAWGPPVFAAIHVGAGTGILLEWLKPRRAAAPATTQRLPAAPPNRRAA